MSDVVVLIVGCDVVMLSEDMTMSGFVPLLAVPQIPMYVHGTVDKVRHTIFLST